MSGYTIYRIYNLETDKCYVGVTCNKRERKSHHFAALMSGKHHSDHLQKSYNKYGRKAFKWQIIESNLSKDDAYEREVAWINFYDSYYNGYNMTIGGEGGASTPCEWEGKQYNSISEMAEDLGISRASAQRTVASGATNRFEKAKLNGFIAFEWNNVKYPSIRQAARELGVSKTCIRHRIKQGYTCDEDIVRAKAINGHKCLWNGIEYSSVRAASTALGISDTTMQSRLDNGYTCDDDITGNSRKCTWNGIEYDSIKAASEANDITPDGMRRRIINGYTCDDDIERQDIKCTWNDIEYPNIASAALALNISQSAMLYRYRKGYVCDADLVKPSVAKTPYNKS